ncbi:hypothetical protein Hanom_Chr05g00435501 [Helianthus anomalus]
MKRICGISHWIRLRWHTILYMVVILLANCRYDAFIFLFYFQICSLMFCPINLSNC